MTGDPLDRIMRRRHAVGSRNWFLVTEAERMALVEVARAAREIGRPGRSVEMEFPYLAERIEALRAALARLDGPR